jgi:hypothetical protein
MLWRSPRPAVALNDIPGGRFQRLLIRVLAIGYSFRFSLNPTKARVRETGFALTALGVVCLILSDTVEGWWQGTLIAFGVGFVVGGIVDVLAITALNAKIDEHKQLQEAWQQRFDAQERAKSLMKSDEGPLEKAYAAKKFYQLSSDEIGPSLRIELLHHVLEGLRAEEQRVEAEAHLLEAKLPVRHGRGNPWRVQPGSRRLHIVQRARQMSTDRIVQRAQPMSTGGVGDGGIPARPDPAEPADDSVP